VKSIGGKNMPRLKREIISFSAYDATPSIGKTKSRVPNRRWQEMPDERMLRYVGVSDNQYYVMYVMIPSP
jgi:hypothetical protein